MAIDDPDPSKQVTLRLHMGIGCGDLTAVHVGGVFKRWEYILAGPPMAQIAVAEPLAKPGETVVSPEAWGLVRPDVVGTSIGTLIAKGLRKPIGQQTYHGKHRKKTRQRRKKKKR